MNDTEFFVSRKKNPYMVWLQAAIFMAAVGLIVLLYLAAGGIAFAPAPFILLAAYLGIRTLSIYSKLEFEYSLSGNILNIDRIYKQVRRKPLLRITVSEIVAFGRMGTPEQLEAAKKVVKVICCDSREEDFPVYFLTCQYEGKGLHMFIIEPNAKMLLAMRKLSPVVAKALMTES